MAGKKPDLKAAIAAAQADGAEVVVDRQGEVKKCLINFINCRTHQMQMVELQAGEEFYYGDWDGRECVRKVFRCPG